MPRVLDIDLDFFMDTIESVSLFHIRRRSSRHHRVWTENEVRDFLEQRCGLSTDAPIPTGFGVHHHEAFEFWRERVAAGELQTPFEIVHIDGHADLGAGAYGLDYIRHDVLYRPVGDRPDVNAGKDRLNPGNYLLYAIASRWVSSLTYVTHPKWDTADIHMPIYEGNPPFAAIQTDEVAKAATLNLSTIYNPAPASERRTFLEQLFGKKEVPSYEYTRCEGTIRLTASAKKGVEMPAPEPGVPFQTISGALYQNNAPWGFMFLSQSPAYTPGSADALIPVILSYGNVIKGAWPG